MSTIKKYQELVKSKEVITENQIRSLKNFINKRARHNMSCYEFTEFKPKRITPEQSIKGLNWLRNKLLKLDGTQRKSNLLNLTDYEREIFVKVLNNFKAWQFVGFYEVSGPMSYFVPIYRMIAKNKDYIQYSVSGQGMIFSCSIYKKGGM